MPDYNFSYIKILSDSQAAIKSLNKPRITSQSQVNCIRTNGNTSYTQVQHLTIAWIKAHVGTEGNEQADQAAKEGAAGGAYVKQVKTPIPWQVAKNRIEEYKWTNKWKSDPQWQLPRRRAHGWSNKPPAPGTDDAEPVFQIPVGLPRLERGLKKTLEWLN